MARPGQALVEFALILPIFLMLILGGVTLGLLEIHRYELVHAAIEGASAGADVRGRSQCRIAVDTAIGVLGRPASSSCRVLSRYLELSLSETVALPVPFLGNSWTVSVTERSSFR